jgi:hypothetical protein
MHGNGDSVDGAEIEAVVELSDDLTSQSRHSLRLSVATTNPVARYCFATAQVRLRALSDHERSGEQTRRGLAA